MDSEIRTLEKQLASEPDNKVARGALIRAWTRAGIEPSDAAGLALIQADWYDRFDEIRSEGRSNGQERFKKFMENAFAEYPKLEKVLYQSAVPHFMDGDPLREDHSIMLSPRWFCNYGILESDDVYENFDPTDRDFWKKERAGDFTYKPGVLNSGLSVGECELLEEQFWKFSQVMYDMWGTNTRVWVYREEREEESHWLPKGVNWERIDYDSGY